MTSCALAALSASAAPAVRVGGEGTCPAPPAVEQRLGPLLAEEEAAPDGGGGEAKPRLVVLSPGRSGVWARLTEEAGLVVAERWFPSEAGDCSAQAEAVAVVVASWMAQLRSGVALVPAPVPGPATTTAAEVVSAGAAGAARWSPLAALYASFGGGGVAPAAKIGFRRHRPGGVLALDGTLGGIGPGSVDFAGGRTRWGRLALALGPTWGYRPKSVTLVILAAGAHVAVGAVLLDGGGFARNLRSAGLDVGGVVGGSVGFRLAGFTPWIGVEGVGWARKHELTVVGGQERQELPRVQLLVGMGATFGADR